MTDERIAPGIALLDQGRLEEVATLFRTLSTGGRDGAGAVFDLALRFHRTGSLAKAIVLYRSLADTPLSPAAHSNMASALKRLGRMDEALAACVEAVVRTPDLAEAHATMGAILQESDHPAAALDACRRAVALSPGLHGAYMALGHALQDLGDHEGCCRALTRSVLLEPARASTHYNLAESLLRNGRSAEGWREYEWRWEVRELGFERPASGTPEWAGQDLAGKTLLVCEEQGFGDTLQFVRLAALVAARGARVILHCRPPLVRLLSGALGVDAVVTDAADASGCDYRVSLMSLMHRLGASLERNPVPGPYLRAPAEPWSLPVPAPEALRVGLVWAGDPRLGRAADRRMDLRRSLALDQFAPLFRIPRLSWVSLQKGVASRQLETSSLGPSLLDPMGEVRDYADTAAIVARLDLVIGVDTSVVHLAGALGKPVWALSRFDGCWRWLLGREDSPWYPTLRLFRQERPGDWGAVVARIAGELSRVAEGDRDRLLPPRAAAG